MTAISAANELVVKGGDYEHTLEFDCVRDGRKIRYEHVFMPRFHGKVIKGEEFQACEFSMSNYIILKSGGDDSMTAVPAFPKRAYRHASIIVRRDSNLTDLTQLKGGKIGVIDYSMTAAIWAKGLMLEDYGVHWSDMEWICTDDPRFPAPEGVRISRKRENLESLLENSDIDALLHPNSSDNALPREQRRFRPLLENHVEIEKEYFQRTGIYPINHVAILKKSILDDWSGAAQAVYDSYLEGKNKAFKRRLGTTFLPWADSYWREVMELYDGDPLPYGLTPQNIITINTLIAYLREQGFIDKDIKAQDLFEPVREDSTPNP